jgi:cardiolipin synthase
MQSGLMIQPWTAELVVTDGDAYLCGLLADIAAASRRIDLESYIVEADEVGTQITSALAAASARGVEVRLLVDGNGALNWIQGPGASFRGCPWRIYHPVPWTVLRTYLPTLRQLLARLQAFRFANRRNHRKTCVIDERIAWIGSFNLERRHYRSLAGDDAWRDTAARVEGDGVQLITRAFTLTWRQSWRYGKRFLLPATGLLGRLLAVDLGAPVRINSPRQVRRRIWYDLLQRIRQARGRVWITTPYFVPNEDLLKALAAAAKHADVRMLLPAINDIGMMPYIARVYFARLDAAGVRVWAYPRMVHAKTMLIDNLGLVGSSNLNSRSLLFDLEADVWLQQPSSIATLAQAFTSDCSAAQEIVSGQRPSLRWRVLGNLFLSMRRWL